MIRITGPDRNRILATFDRKTIVASKNGGVEVNHDYTNALTCAPAEVTDETVTIKTYHEDNDARIIMKKALIMNLDVNAQVV